MNINWNSFEEGFKSFEKEANMNLLGGLQGLLGSGIPQLPQSQPILPNGFTQPAPRININLGTPKSILSPNPGEVNSINRPRAGQAKLAFVDPTLLKNLVTAGAIKNTAQKLIAPSPQPVNQEQEKRIILESKYPEVKKLLADPQTKTYLESLLTEDIAHEH
jgi:hypothetical protein